MVLSNLDNACKFHLLLTPTDTQLSAVRIWADGLSSAAERNFLWKKWWKAWSALQATHLPLLDPARREGVHYVAVFRRHRLVQHCGHAHENGPIRLLHLGPVLRSNRAPFKVWPCTFENRTLKNVEIGSSIVGISRERSRAIPPASTSPAQGSSSFRFRSL